MKELNQPEVRKLAKSLNLIVMAVFLIPFLFLSYWLFLNLKSTEKQQVTEKKEFKPKTKVWELLKMDAVVHEKDPELIRYGRELVANTAQFLGPKGTVKQLSNGMNCQNCHLDAGTKPWGNNYGAVLSTYPKFRERSGTVENIHKRINDCFERSLNGQALDTTSREMKAMVSYINFVGKFVRKDSIPEGTGIWKMKFLNRAASPTNGQAAYTTKCVSCHGQDGEGIKSADGSVYVYPPLWGQHAYNQGAGLFRLSKLAGYIKVNMPFGATFENPQLTDEEAWDIAAFVNSQPRPTKDLSNDWPKIAGKPFDHPFGPFADPFSEEQHKYGPFKPIDEFKKAQKKKKITSKI